MVDFALVVPENFIQATRDSGYKNLGSALAELIDNAFEAKASQVAITIERTDKAGTADVEVRVIDDGCGMDRRTLRHALQFGWSSRFNLRDSHGRYGMGLPNASLSHARRVEVISSHDGNGAAGTYLDVDEVVADHTEVVPKPRGLLQTQFVAHSPFKRGTVVSWSKCDRLVGRKLGPLTRKLRSEIGRLFRYQLWAGKTITVNGEPVAPFDPLFLREGANIVGAHSYGPELSYEVASAAAPSKGQSAIIKVLFTELPIKEWHTLSNADKNALLIAKNAGVSIVRAGREIDTGWFFMGQKRKENYDDWWRCEVRFEPTLDELFGVTHTKQEIHPTEELLSILVPDIEKIARELNGRARRTFFAVKTSAERRKSELRAERYDRLIEPPTIRRQRPKHGRESSRKPKRGRITGLRYRILFQELDTEELYKAELQGSCLTLFINEAHPFVRCIWANSEKKITSETQRDAELLLFALARSEFVLATKPDIKRLFANFRKAWSKNLATFLS